MKILSTLVSDHVASRNQGLSFAKKFSDIPETFKELLDGNYILADDGVGNKLIVWNRATCMIFADARVWLKRQDESVIKFSVLFFKTPEQLALEEMGIRPLHKQYVDGRTLYGQLIETYMSLGIDNWVEQGAPVGLRSIVAYQHGYTMTPEFNTALSTAMAEADNWLIYNLQQVTIESDLRMN